jgi:hypothetical protein
LAFANIEKAAKYHDVNLAKTSWHDLGIHPQRTEERLPPKALWRVNAECRAKNLLSDVWGVSDQF